MQKFKVTQSATDCVTFRVHHAETLMAQSLANVTAPLCAFFLGLFFFNLQIQMYLLCYSLVINTRVSVIVVFACVHVFKKKILSLKMYHSPSVYPFLNECLSNEVKVRCYDWLFSIIAQVMQD